MKNPYNTPLIIPNAFHFSKSVVEALLTLLLIWWYKNHPSPEERVVGVIKSVECTEEDDIYIQLQSDTKLRERHIAKLQARPSFRQLSVQQASEVVDSMLRFTALAYDMVMDKERRSNALPPSF